MKGLFAIIALFPALVFAGSMSIDGGKTATLIDGGKTATSIQLRPVAIFSNHPWEGVAACPIFLLRCVGHGVEHLVFDANGNDLYYDDGWVDHSGFTLFLVAWHDQTGSGDDATQTTAARQPGVTLGITYPTFNFDGIDDNLDVSGIAYTPSDFTFIIRMRQPTPTGGQQRVFHSYNSVIQFLALQYPGSTPNTISWIAPGLGYQLAALSTTSLFNATFLLSTTTVMYADKIALTPSSPNYAQTGISGTTKIGSSRVQTLFFYGDMETLLIYDQALKEAKIFDINDYLDGL